MKHRLVLLATLLSSFVLTATSLGAAADFDDAHRFVFYAVLEGCYEDGLSTDDVSQILMKREKETYLHFVYSCPICTPTIHALEAYQSRPKSFSGLKTPASTFGPGLAPDLKQQLYSRKPEERLAAINSLVQRWTERRMSMLNFTAAERDRLRKALEEKRNKGMEVLKKSKAAGTDWFSASGFSVVEECAACNGAVGRKLKLPGTP